MNLFNPFRLLKKKPAPPVPPPPEHVHSWKPISVNHGEMGGYATTDGKPLKVTEVLQVCSCGDYYRAIAWGIWSLEQTQAGELSKDVIELNRMAGL